MSNVINCREDVMYKIKKERLTFGQNLGCALLS